MFRAIDEVSLEELRKRMYAKKISGKRLAERVGMANSSMSRKLNGKSEFTVSEAIRVCNALEMHPADIFFV